MTIENIIEDRAEAKDSAKEELREAWGCDDVDMSGDSVVLTWRSEVEEAGENVKALSEELYTAAEKNPDATIQTYADTTRFTIQVQVN